MLKDEHQIGVFLQWAEERLAKAVKEDEDYEVDSNHGKSLVKFKKDNTQGKTIQEQLNRALK